MYPIQIILEYLEDTFLYQKPKNLEPLMKSRTLNDSLVRIALQTCLLNDYIYYCSMDETKNVVFSSDLPVKIDNYYIPSNKKLYIPLHKDYILSPKGYEFLVWFKNVPKINLTQKEDADSTEHTD